MRSTAILKNPAASSAGAGAAPAVAISAARKTIRLDASEEHVRIRDRQRPAVPITGRTRLCAGRLGTDLQAPARELEDRAAPGGDGVDAQHRRDDAHAADDRRRRSLEAVRMNADVRGCSAHVESDDALEPALAGRVGHADDAAGGAREDTVTTAKRACTDETAVTLHEHEPVLFEHVRKAGTHARDVFLKNRREVRIGDRSIAALDELDRRAHFVRHGNVRESRARCASRDAPLVLRKSVAVQERDRSARETLLARAPKVLVELVFIERKQRRSVCGDPFLCLDDAAVEHVGKADLQREDLGALLRAYA
jgi:hypothetical protein